MVAGYSEKSAAAQTPESRGNLDGFLDNLDGFLDIPWGENTRNAARILEEKGCAWEINDDFIDARGKFTGADAKLLLFFPDEMFSLGHVTFLSKDLEKDYDEYVSLVTEKYGNPSHTVHNDNSLGTVWVFDNNTVLDVFFETHVSILYRASSEYFENMPERVRQKKEQERQTIINDL